MSKRAEEIAKQLYPESSGPMERSIFEDRRVTLACRRACEEGYEKAEEDLALTIEDIELLHTFLYAIKNNKHGCFTFTRLSDEQYEEVLRRFRETKNK